jgi:hypothetical protein
MNVEIGTGAAQFPEREYIPNWDFRCSVGSKGEKYSDNPSNLWESGKSRPLSFSLALEEEVQALTWF